MRYIKLYEDYKSNLPLSFFPSEEFSKKSGIEGIFTEWKLPPKYDFHKLYNLAISSNNSNSKALLNKIIKVYIDIVKLNPELRDIEINDVNDIIITLHGIASKFIKDDIKLFVSLDKYNLRNYNLNNDSLISKIEAKVGISMQWLACPETLMKIRTALKIK